MLTLYILCCMLRVYLGFLEHKSMDKFQKARPFYFFSDIPTKRTKRILCLEPLLPPTNNIPTCVFSSRVVNHEMNPGSSKERKKKKKE